jgi:plastocyanin
MTRRKSAALRAALHPSRSSETDGDLSAFDDHRNAAFTREANHSRELFLVSLDVDVGERDLPTRVVLTGRGRVGSGVLSEYLDAIGFHPRLPSPRDLKSCFKLLSKTLMSTRFFAAAALLLAHLTPGWVARAAASPGTVAGRVLLVKGASTRPDASNAVVWIEGPRTRSDAPSTLAMTQESKRFSPRVLIVPRQGTVEFPNNDPVYHNVFSVSGANRFDLGLYRSGASKSRSFAEPGLVRVYCNIHPQMVGFLMVVDSDFAAVTDRDGKFRFDGVPAGTWTLHAWHEAGKETTVPLVVPATGDAPLTLSIDTTAYRPVPHKNKYGKEYPPQSGTDDERY